MTSIQLKYHDTPHFSFGCVLSHSFLPVGLSSCGCRLLCSLVWSSVYCPPFTSPSTYYTILSYLKKNTHCKWKRRKFSLCTSNISFPWLYVHILPFSFYRDYSGGSLLPITTFNIIKKIISDEEVHYTPQEEHSPNKDDEVISLRTDTLDETGYSTLPLLPDEDSRWKFSVVKQREIEKRELARFLFRDFLPTMKHVYSSCFFWVLSRCWLYFDLVLNLEIITFSDI